MLCWYNWFGKFSSDIWNMVPGCLMWVIWMERNRHSFEDLEKSLDQLQALSQSTLFEWARCWGSSNCSSIREFLTTLDVPLKISFFCCLFLLFFCVHHHEHLVLVVFAFSSSLI